ncbi:MAG: PEP-CTERM sorting domain-containing protein [Gemmatimonadaceae bacterium]
MSASHYCIVGAYAFAFNYDAPSWLGLSTFTLAASGDLGDSMDFLFGTFTPVGGTAPAGVYNVFDAALLIGVDGVDDGGNAISAEFTAADTCPTSAPSCAFSRTITGDATTSTPEPATFGLLGLGLGFVGVIRRRGKATAA